jgi:hypothetical protein
MDRCSCTGISQSLCHRDTVSISLDPHRRGVILSGSAKYYRRGADRRHPEISGDQTAVSDSTPFVYDASLEDQEASAVYENASPGTVVGVLCDVIPYGFKIEKAMEPGKKDRQVFKLDLIFQVDEINSRGYRFNTRRRCNLSLFEKATFRPFYEALIGRKVTAAEEAGKEKVGVKTIIGLIGTSVLLNLVPSPDGGKYTNIQGVMPLPKGMAGLDVENYVRYKDRPVAA